MESPVPDDIKSWLLDYAFMVEIKEYTKSLSPFWNMLNQLSKQKLHWATEQWLKLSAPSPEHSYKFELAKSKCLTGPALMAYYLNPYCNNQFTKDEVYATTLSDFAFKFDKATLQAYLKYKRNDSDFKQCKAKLLDISSFWDFFSEKYPGLSRVATQLLELPSSSYVGDTSISHKFEDLDYDKVMTIKFDINKNI